MKRILDLQKPVMGSGLLDMFNPQTKRERLMAQRLKEDHRASKHVMSALQLYGQLKEHVGDVKRGAAPGHGRVDRQDPVGECGQDLCFQPATQDRALGGVASVGGRSILRSPSSGAGGAAGLMGAPAAGGLSPPPAPSADPPRSAAAPSASTVVSAAASGRRLTA